MNESSVGNGTDIRVHPPVRDPRGFIILVTVTLVRYKILGNHTQTESVWYPDNLVNSESCGALRYF